VPAVEVVHLAVAAAKGKLREARYWRGFGRVKWPQALPEPTGAARRQHLVRSATARPSRGPGARRGEVQPGPRYTFALKARRSISRALGGATAPALISTLSVGGRERARGLRERFAGNTWSGPRRRGCREVGARDGLRQGSGHLTKRKKSYDKAGSCQVEVWNLAEAASDNAPKHPILTPGKAPADARLGYTSAGRVRPVPDQ
jgi:hypothetical protein